MTDIKMNSNQNNKNNNIYRNINKRKTGYVLRCVTASVLAATMLASAGCAAQEAGTSSADQSAASSARPGETPGAASGILHDGDSSAESDNTSGSSGDDASVTESSEESTEISHHEHEYGEFVAVEDPGCEKAGKALAVCECGDTIEKEIPALGHEYVVTRQNGLTVYYKCERCGAETSENKPVKENKDINDLIIHVESEHTYDGKLFKPEVIITDGDEDVTYSARIEYDENAVGVGSYFLTISLHGNYSGTRRYEYKIFPAVPQAVISEESDTSCTVSWAECAAADGYILEYAFSRDFSEIHDMILNRQECSCTIEGLDKTVPCYIRVRSFADVRISGSNTRYKSVAGNELQYGKPHIEVINGITYVDGILIANKTYSLPSDYSPGFLSETQNAFDEMAAAAARDGIYLYIVSGYRSYSTQYSTYNYFVYDRGVEQADRCSARPGHSEHQTGLACDINTTSSSFEGTPEAIWIDENCWKYGFIVRYPKGKEDITGYKYEPWHVRYLGKDIAKKVYDSGLTLEEYLGIDSYYH